MLILVLPLALLLLPILVLMESGHEKRAAGCLRGVPVPVPILVLVLAPLARRRSLKRSGCRGCRSWPEWGCWPSWPRGDLSVWEDGGGLDVRGAKYRLPRGVSLIVSWK